MRICFVASLYPPYILGGAEVYLRNLAEHLSKGHDVSVITTAPYRGRASLRPQLRQAGPVKVYEFYPFNVYHLSRRPAAKVLKAVWSVADIYNWHSRITVGRLLAHIRPELVHSHNLRGLSVSVWDAVKHRRLPLVHTLHDYHLLCQNSLLWHQPTGLCNGRAGVCRLYRPVMRRLCDSKPDLALSPSVFVLDKHLAGGLFGCSRRVVLPIGIAVPDQESIVAGMPRSALRVLYMGMVSRHKGVRYLVQAFRQLSAPDARLDIAGHGDLELAECRRLAGGDPRIAFLGFLDGADKERAFARANVVALPSIWPDNSPVTILESLVRGKVILASRVGGIPELIESEVNGLLVEPGDAAGLSAGLERLDRDVDLRARLAENARLAGRGLSVAAHAAKLEGFYEAL